MFDTPILFLVFNRLETTKLVFDRIKTVRPKYLYIGADGPRIDKKKESEECIRVREYILINIDWDCEVKTLFRDQNLGCGKAVSNAITWFFENVEEGIILEDDCLPDMSFFRFCEELLDKYKNNEKIISICGTNILPNYIVEHSYIYSLYGGNWGWATWRNSWQLFNYQMDSWSDVNNQKVIRKNLKSQEEFLGIKKLFDEMLNVQGDDIWDFQWFYTRLLYNKLTIVPAKNLIKNIGFGNLATHTLEDGNKLNQLVLNNISFPLKHNKNIKPNRKFDRENSKFYGWYINESRTQVLKLKIKRLIGKIR